ncbi:hypothetical protein RHSIM_Rhsim02G0052100 [Rhododendron simsii]|uniref:Uncharacterized protein n=1 Tax=Rhododendron simsii TaxID=118357 RepID=A0A834HCG8_RHOSS|nr:hypothetical protein RHSIM_Rhsim02G0052100 [Rhododendron simsii]
MYNLPRFPSLRFAWFDRGFLLRKKQHSFSIKMRRRRIAAVALIFSPTTTARNNYPKEETTDDSALDTIWCQKTEEAKTEFANSSEIQGVICFEGSMICGYLFSPVIVKICHPHHFEVVQLKKKPHRKSE